MRTKLWTPVLLALAAWPLAGQDERRVSSPDGQLEFRLAVAQPQAGALFRLAYQIVYRGRPLIDTSFLGFNIHNQEPLLGENAGLTNSRTTRGDGFNTLVAEYMQNGSIGRRIDVEVRAADDGIAFRYRIPRTTPLEEILIEDELTEFAVDGIEMAAAGSLPMVGRLPGPVWVEIAETKSGAYPAARLERAEGAVLVTRLAAATDDSHIAYQGTTPLVCPWRMVVVAKDREHLATAAIRRAVAR